MKTIKLFLIVAIAISASSCGVMETFVTHVFDSAPLDNRGTYHNYTQQETIDMIMNTREAKAWNQSATSKGLFLASSGLSIVEELTGKNFSFARGVMDATVDDLISDDNKAKSEEGNLIGAAFYGAGHAIGYVEDMHKAEDNEAFLAAHKEERKNDPFFNCRYKIDEKTGRYYNVIKTDGVAEVQKCIQEKQQAEAQQILEEALALCDPFITQEYLDELANGTEKDQIKRHKIIYDALKCYKENKQAEELSNYNDVSDEDGTQDVAINDIINTLNNTEGEDVNTANGENFSTVATSYSNDLIALKETKVTEYKLNSYQLNDANKKELDKVAEILHRNSEWTIELRGHCCDLGDDQVNNTIGMLRAKEAQKYLVKKGVDGSRISTISMGSKQPIVANDSPSNRALNRRVEIVIVK